MIKRIPEREEVTCDLEKSVNPEKLVAWDVSIHGMRSIVFATTEAKARWQGRAVLKIYISPVHLPKCSPCTGCWDCVGEPPYCRYEQDPAECPGPANSKTAADHWSLREDLTPKRAEIEEDQR